MIPGDDVIKVLDLSAEGQVQSYHDMLMDYHRLYFERGIRPGFRQKNSKELHAHLQSLRSRLSEKMGFMDLDRTGVEWEGGAILKNQGFTCQPGSFQSWPGRWVSGLLYRPDPMPAQACPGILIVHGHSPDGKTQLQTQLRSANLAKRGFVVLAIDTIGHGERRPVGHVDFALFATGKTHQGHLLHDNRCALDLLTQFEGVDPSKIGMTGSSGGGTQTLFTAALDDRVTAAAPVAAICSYEDHMKNTSSDFCLCEVIPGWVQQADIGDILALIAPRAAMIIHGTRDRTFPVKGMREAYLRAKDVYRTFSAEDQLSKVETYNPHAYSRSMREALYDFFEQTLKGQASSKEKDGLWREEANCLELKSLSASKLQENEKVQTLVYRESMNILNASDHPQKWINEEEGLEQYRDYWKKNKGQVLGEPIGDKKEARVLKQTPLVVEDCIGESYLCESECGVLLPVFSIIQEKVSDKSNAPQALFLAQAGKERLLVDQRVRDLLDQGYRVIGIDVRGTGETCYSYYLEEEMSAINALMTGRSLLGGRALDLEVIVELLGLSVDLVWITDSFSLYALMAEIEVSHWIIENTHLTLVSENGFKEKAIEQLFVPGILKYMDIPQWVGLLKARSVSIFNSIDSKGQVCRKEEIEGTLKWTLQAFTKEQVEWSCGILNSQKDRLELLKKIRN